MVKLCQRVVTAMVGTLLIGCTQYQRLPSADPNVSNGIWLESSTILLQDGDTLEVPAGTQVTESSASRNVVEVFIQKKLHYLGHPVEKLSISDIRRRMCCATLRSGSVVRLSTIGGFSTQDGGASVHIKCVVPEGTSVDYSPELRDFMKMSELKDQSEWVRLQTDDNN